MKILFATDGSRSAENALERLPRLIERKPADGRFEIVVLAIPSTVPGCGATKGRPGCAAAFASLTRSKEILARQGITPRSIWRMGADAAASILDIANREHADLVVLGTKAAPTSDGPLNEVAFQVLDESPVPVWLLKNPL